MLRSEAGEQRAPGPPAVSFVLYVEGPRDRDILSRWARTVSGRLGRAVEESSVILGGRRPARAVEHFREHRGREAGARALCVLDRDGGATLVPGEPGLEFYTWRRRHIESYLLVPDAIRRTLGMARHDLRVERLLREQLPAEDDEDAWGEVDAKRLLHPQGPLARALGRRLPPGRIARTMQRGELHPDVVDFLERLRRALGLHSREPRVVARDSS